MNTTTQFGRVEQVRREVDRLCWTGIGLGMAFTMTNVQAFAAHGAAAWSPAWLAAWLLDPMVSLVLLAVLRAEQTASRFRVRMGGWARAAKWFTLAATYVMNTAAAWSSGSAALVVLHSVPPLTVFVAAEAITTLRDKLTEALDHIDPEPHASAAGDEAPPPADVLSASPAADAAPRPAGAAPGSGRRSFEDYFAIAETAWEPGVEVTPAWVRMVTGCSRGLSSRLAPALRERHEAAHGVEGVAR